MRSVLFWTLSSMSDRDFSTGPKEARVWSTSVFTATAWFLSRRNRNRNMVTQRSHSGLVLLSCSSTGTFFFRSNSTMFPIYQEPTTRF